MAERQDPSLIEPLARASFTLKDHGTHPRGVRAESGARSRAAARADFGNGATMEMKTSKHGKYLSITCTINAVSREQLDALYQELCDHPMVVMVL